LAPGGSMQMNLAQRQRQDGLQRKPVKSKIFWQKNRGDQCNVYGFHSPPLAAR